MAGTQRLERSLRWGVLGTGKIARIFADGIARSRTGSLQAVASRDSTRGESFARQYEAAAAYGSYHALLEDPDVDIVYVATPHPTHLELGRAAAAAGKHLLCEKPLAVNRRDAQSLIDCCGRDGVFMMEAFAYRCHPQTDRIRTILASGALGEIRYVEASFGYNAGPAPQNYLLRHQLAGGSILDVGCYLVSLIQLIAEAEPCEIGAVANVGEDDRCDHYAAASLSFAGGLICQIACSIQVNQPNTLAIYGTGGQLVADSPWLPGRLGEPTQITVEDSDGRRTETFALEHDANLYSLEADHVADAVRAGARQSPAMTWADTVACMRTIDRWHEAIGVEYA